MANLATFIAGIATIASDCQRIKIDPHKLKFHRSRIEPSGEELKARNERRLSLAQSWLESPVHDIIVRDGDYAIADGNERVAGILLLGVKEIGVTLLPADTSDEALEDMAFQTAYHRTALTAYEQAQIIIKKRKGGMTGQEIAAKLKISAGQCSKLYSLADCVIEVQEAARDGKVGCSEWHVISQSPDQSATLALKLRGATRDELQKTVRKPKPDAVRVAKIKCPLPSGQVVTVSGEEASLEDAIESCLEAAKLMKAAVSKGLNAKTAQNVWRDVAAAS